MYSHTQYGSLGVSVIVEKVYRTLAVEDSILSQSMWVKMVKMMSRY